MTVNTFLGCFELETGGLVLGWLNLIWSLISIAAYSFLFVKSFYMPLILMPILSIYVAAVGFSVNLFCLWISISLIKGTKQVSINCA